MERLRQALPPTTSLVTFEAAARHRNFTQAARELGVSQAAVSRQIHILEDNLGVSLFQRGGRPLALTADGQRLYDVVSVGLSSIAGIAVEMRRRSSPGAVAVAASVAFTSMWLMPRVSAFRSVHPEIALRLIAMDPFGDPSRDQVDLAVRFGTGRWPELTAAPLFDDLVFPVAAPAFLEARGVPGDLSALASAPLLHLDEIDPSWIPWRSWFERLDGPSAPRHRDAIAFNAYPNLIQAAVDGQGVALGWAHLIRREIERGALCRITDAVLEPSERQYLTWPSGIELGPEAVLFRDWLLAEAAADAITPADLPEPARHSG